MRPSEAYEAIADIVTQTIKRPYRDEPVSFAEWDTIAERIAMFIDKQQYPANGDWLEHHKHVQPSLNCHLCKEPK